MFPTENRPEEPNVVEPRAEEKYTYAMPRDHPLVSIYSKLLQQPILAIVKSVH